MILHTYFCFWEVVEEKGKNFTFHSTLNRYIFIRDKKFDLRFDY